MAQNQNHFIPPRFDIADGLPGFVADLREIVFESSLKAAAYFLIGSHTTILRYEKKEGPGLIHPPAGYVAALIKLLYEQKANPSNALQLQEHLLAEYNQAFRYSAGFKPPSNWRALLKRAEDYIAQTRFEQLPKQKVPKLASVAPISRRPQLVPNPLFVGRSKELKQIAAWIGQKNPLATPVCVLSGMGGLGKSQLALEVMYRYGPYFSGGVFWLHAADRHQLQNEIALCGGGKHLNLRPDFDQLPLSERTRLVMAEWSKDIPRLLIFDNCEDERLLAQWRPLEGGCRIVVTSRRLRWNPTLPVHQLHLEVLEESDSIELLARYRPDLAEGKQRPLLAKFAYLVGYLPLALHLVGSYLHLHKEEAPEIYLQELEKSYVLAHNSLQAGDRHYSPTDHPQHIERMIELSFSQIAADELAVKLLQMLAYSAPGEVVQRFVIDTCLPEYDSGALSHSLEQLAALALIRLQDDGSVWMHRLIADFILLKHPAEAIRTQLEQGIDQLIKAHHADHAEQIKLLQRLEVQLRWLADKVLERKDHRAAMVAYWFAYHLWVKTMVDQADYYITQLYNLFHQPDSHDELSMLANICELRGLIQQSSGKFAQARVWYEECLDIRSEVLDLEHPDVATAHNNLGHVCYVYHDLHAGEQNLSQATQMRRRIYGLRHHNTARSINNLAYIYYRQGQWRRAERYFKLALNIRSDLGAWEADLLQSKVNLIYVALEQGHYAKARSSSEEIVAQPQPERSKKLVCYADALWRLGQIELFEGRIERAQELIERAYACFSELMQPNNIELLDLQIDIAKILIIRREYQRARELLDYISREISDQFDAKHFWMLRVYEASVQLELAQGHTQAAEEAARNYLYVACNCTADQHPRIARAHQLLASSLAAQKRIDEAKEQVSLAYDLAQKHLHPSHPWYLAIQSDYQHLQRA
jgi:tetratricopeptide (TPR) repeat protein